jgi:small subunit ribosomal protein S1
MEEAGDEAGTAQETQDQASAMSSSLPPGGMGDWLAEHEKSVRQWRRGEVVEGVVVSADRDEFLVDIGAKSEAVVPLSEVPQSEVPSVGETVLAYVLSGEDQEGRVVLSLTRARAERGWRNLQRRFEEGQTVEGDVVEHNKGGLVVNVEGVRGFVPLSQIADLRRGGPDESVEARLEAMKGRTLLLKVIEMNRRRNRLILSERAALQERRAREKDRLLTELQPGDTRSGTVSSICDFGAFVDLGGADGLVHLSELSWGQVSHPSQVVKVGDQVDVYVVGVDRDNKKIALSLKRLQGEPWSRVNDKYAVGQVVNGRITKLAAFGAFAEIEPGVEGLIHISELSEDRITHPKQVVREGDELPLKIIRIEPARHRLGLSLRQVDEEPYGYGDEYTADVVEAAVGTAPAYDQETETNGTDAEGADAGNLSAYGEQPEAATVGVADHASSITEVPGEHAPDADEASSEASSVEPSGARPASIAEG